MPIPSVNELMGPALNSGSPQSEYANAILKNVKRFVLNDMKYVERIKTHYRLFKNKINLNTD